MVEVVKISTRQEVIWLTYKCLLEIGIRSSKLRTKIIKWYWL